MFVRLVNVFFVRKRGEINPHGFTFSFLNFGLNKTSSLSVMLDEDCF